jgi:hypothetical protein
MDMSCNMVLDYMLGDGYECNEIFNCEHFNFDEGACVGEGGGVGGGGGGGGGGV